MTETSVVPVGARMGLPRALVVEARPKQWVKNVLVVAAPGAAGVLAEPRALALTAVAFVAFSLASSGVYYLNDADDVDADRRHPVKRHRPMAAGLISPPLGRTVGAGLVAAGLAVAVVTSPPLAAVLCAYVALAVAYSHWLKAIVVVDIAAVAAGFVLRAAAGAAAVDVPLSRWFLIVASAGSLFMVAGKRSADRSALVEDDGRPPTLLSGYPPEFLRFVRLVAAVVLIVAYVLFAFERTAMPGTAGPWFELSAVPFVLAVFRYALLVETGLGGTPEDVVLGDRPLLVMGLAWAAVFGLGVQLAH